MTPQMEASLALQQWQALRRAGLTPDQRINALVDEFWQVPIELDTAFQDQLKAVAAEMADA